MSKPLSHNLYKPNPGLSTDKKDHDQIQWGIQKDAGFVVGRSSFPVLFTGDGHNVHLEDYAKGSAIVICTKTTKRVPPNVHTMAVGPCQCDPSIIVSNSPANINARQLRNPAIMKLIPASMASMSINQLPLYHYPFVVHYRKHKSFNAASFFLEETVWGDGHPESDVFAAIKLAYVLGYREIFVGDIPKSEKVYRNLGLLMRYSLNVGMKLSKIDKGPEEIPTVSIDEAYAKCIL